MARLAASLMLAGAACVAPALAGDRALLEIIGYSPDGRYFAFEESGIQDGSGFPYANIFAVDLPADAWVAGTPVRVRLDDETAGVAEARQAARSVARPILERLAAQAPAHLVALAGDGEAGDGLVLDFGLPGYLPGELTGSFELALDIFETDSPEDCITYMGEAPKGYALRLAGEGMSREVHRDGTMLPASRGCPLTYRLYGVVIPAGAAGLESAVAIVSVYPFGFEGPDRRFLAVPLGD